MSNNDANKIYLCSNCTRFAIVNCQLEVCTPDFIYLTFNLAYVSSLSSFEIEKGWLGTH